MPSSRRAGLLLRLAGRVLHAVLAGLHVLFGTEPVERIKVGKETDVQDHQVSEEVHKEQVAVDDDSHRA